MRLSFIIQVGPKTHGKYPYKRQKRRHTEERAGIGVMQSQAKGLLGPLEAGSVKDRFFLRAFREGAACLCFGFGLPACRMLRGYISNVSHPVCDYMLWQPKETNVQSD